MSANTSQLMLHGLPKPSTSRRPKPAKVKSKQSIQAMQEELAKQELIVEALTAQKAQRDAQMAAVKSAIALLGTSPSRTTRTLDDAPQVISEKSIDSADGQCVTSQEGVGPTSASPEVRTLMSALAAYVVGRESDSAEREALGFFEQQKPSASTPIHSDPNQVDGGSSHADFDYAANLRLLDEEEAALLELASYREAKKSKKGRGGQFKKVKDSPVELNTSATAVSQIEGADHYEDDFEDEGPTTPEDRTKAEVLGRLLEEYAAEVGAEAKRPVGLSWLEDDDQ